MADLDALLARLDGVRRAGRGYHARCPAHDDREPSLSIRQLDDGRILLHDFGGCDTQAVLAAVGLEFRDLMPDRLGDWLPPVPVPINVVRHLRAHERRRAAMLAEDALVIQLAARDLAAGIVPGPEDLRRIWQAQERLAKAAQA